MLRSLILKLKEILNGNSKNNNWLSKVFVITALMISAGLYQNCAQSMSDTSSKTGSSTSDPNSSSSSNMPSSFDPNDLPDTGSSSDSLGDPSTPTTGGSPTSGDTEGPTSNPNPDVTCALALPTVSFAGSSVTSNGTKIVKVNETNDAYEAFIPVKDTLNFGYTLNANGATSFQVKLQVWIGQWTDIAGPLNQQSGSFNGIENNGILGYRIVARGSNCAGSSATVESRVFDIKALVPTVEFKQFIVTRGTSSPLTLSYIYSSFFADIKNANDFGAIDGLVPGTPLHFFARAPLRKYNYFFRLDTFQTKFPGFDMQNGTKALYHEANTDDTCGGRDCTDSTSTRNNRYIQRITNMTADGREFQLLDSGAIWAAAANKTRDFPSYFINHDGVNNLVNLHMCKIGSYLEDGFFLSLDRLCECNKYDHACIATRTGKAVNPPEIVENQFFGANIVGTAFSDHAHSGILEGLKTRWGARAFVRCYNPSLLNHRIAAHKEGGASCATGEVEEGMKFWLLPKSN